MKVILTYKMAHEWDVRELLTHYQKLLQRAIDEIWEKITWKEKKVKHRYSIGNKKYKYYETIRLIPTLPQSKEFKKSLRDKLLQNWPFAKHYVDSAIKTAYSILDSWRKNYLKGRRKRKKTSREEKVRAGQNHVNEG